MRIIGLTGQAGHGKDTAALYIGDAWNRANNARACTRAFADALRREVSQAFRVDMSLLLNPHTKETKTPQLTLNRCTDENFVKLCLGFEFPCVMNQPLTPRFVLQRWGTDYRRTQNPDYWVHKFDEQLRADVCKSAELVVVTDVRFVNEAEMLRNHGAEIWRIVRPNYLKPGWTSAHISERGQAQISVDQTFTNLDLDNLRMQLSDSLLRMCVKNT
jgi:hypothetical protein